MHMYFHAYAAGTLVPVLNINPDSMCIVTVVLVLHITFYNVVCSAAT